MKLIFIRLQGFSLFMLGTGPNFSLFRRLISMNFVPKVSNFILVNSKFKSKLCTSPICNWSLLSVVDRPPQSMIFRNLLLIPLS